MLSILTDCVPRMLSEEFLAFVGKQKAIALTFSATSQYQFSSRAHTRIEALPSHIENLAIALY
jgi:hypothetical protein